MTSYNDMCRTPFYCAPEITTYGRATMASDVYSFGVIVGGLALLHGLVYFMICCSAAGPVCLMCCTRLIPSGSWLLPLTVFTVPPQRRCGNCTTVTCPGSGLAPSTGQTPASHAAGLACQGPTGHSLRAVLTGERGKYQCSYSASISVQLRSASRSTQTATNPNLISCVCV